MLPLTRPLVALDIESTGTNPDADRIVELGLVRLDPDGAREPSAPKRLIPFEWGDCARELQIAVGRVMWLVPFHDLRLGRKSATLYLPLQYVDEVLAAAGWVKKGTVSDLGRDMQKWLLVLADATPEERAE